MGDNEDQKMVYGTAETFQQEPYGEAVPYGDPNWYQGWASPYYKPTHHKFRVQVRKVVEEELMPNCNEWDEAKKMDPEIFSKAFKAGWLPCVVGAPWPREFTGDLEPPEHYDYFHELIAIDEVARCGAGGVLWGLFEGLHPLCPRVPGGGLPVRIQEEDIRQAPGRPPCHQVEASRDGTPSGEHSRHAGSHHLPAVCALQGGGQPSSFWHMCVDQSASHQNFRVLRP